MHHLHLLFGAFRLPPNVRVRLLAPGESIYLSIYLSIYTAVSISTYLDYYICITYISFSAHSDFPQTSEFVSSLQVNLSIYLSTPDVRVRLLAPGKSIYLSVYLSIYTAVSISLYLY